MVGAQRNRDARIDLQGDRIEFERRTQPLEYRSRPCPCSGDVDTVGEQDGELVTTRSGDHVAGPDRPGQSPRDAIEQLVSDMSSGEIVDLLELVDVQQKEG